MTAKEMAEFLSKCGPSLDVKFRAGAALVAVDDVSTVTRHGVASYGDTPLPTSDQYVELTSSELEEEDGTT